MAYPGLDSKVAVVTGAGSGIGRETALRLSAEGASVLIVDVNAKGAKETLGLGDADRLAVLELDVTADDAPSVIMTACETSFGCPDIFVNNAGIGASRPTHKTDDENLDRFLDVNFRSGFRICRELLTMWLAQNRPGVVIHLASVFGKIGFPTSSVYSATKAALVGLTQNQAADYGPHGVRVNAVAPGVIRTPINAARLDDNEWFRDTLLGMTPMGRFGDPKDIAAAIAFLCCDDASFITGQVLAVDGGWSTTKFAPIPG